MKDLYDWQTIDPFKEKRMNAAAKKFQVNYAYQGAKNQKRSNSLIIDAKDIATAKEVASKQLEDLHDWYKITSITAL